MKVKDCQKGMRVRYNGPFKGRYSNPGGDIGVITDTSLHWIKVKFPGVEAWYAAAQLKPAQNTEF